MVAEQAYPNTAVAPLLATRFFLPQLPSALIVRPRLLDQLEQVVQVPITLISAPPGFGKSSLVSQWLHSQANVKASWLSLEPSDQDWSLFFRYLVAAWQRIFPQVGNTALAEWRASPSMRRETGIDLLLNDILASQESCSIDHSLLVLDDYHRIESAEIHETTAYLVEHLPPGCHLVLLTRADPPLPVARWRSRRLLLELRADDLRFTPAESSEYLNHCMQLGLTEEQVGVLFERTEGWIVGLQMAALSLHSSPDVRGFIRDFSGSNRFILDYLMEEVLNSQLDEVKQFLMTTALVDQFCGPLCDAMLNTSAPYSQRMLEKLEKENLFLIPLDDHRSWYRYHHLFAGLLRARLQQLQAGQVPVLYRRAAEWLSQNGLWRNSILYALQAKDLDYGAQLFEEAIMKAGLDFLYSGIKSLIQPFPVEFVHKRPLLSLAKAVAIFDSSQLDGIEPLLRSAEQGIRSAAPFPEQEYLLGLVYLIQTSVATLLGDHTWMVEAGQQIPQWLPNDFVASMEALTVSGNAAYYEGDFRQAETSWQEVLDLSLKGNNPYYTLSLLNGLARLCCQEGEYIRAEGLFQQAFDLLEEHAGQYPIWLGAMKRDYCDFLRERNRLDEALAQVTAALPLLERWHTISALGYGYVSEARLLLAMGDFPGAHAILNKVDDLNRRYTLFPDLATIARVSRAQVYLEDGDTELSRQTIEACLQSPYCQHGFHREWALAAQARLLLRTGHPAEVPGLLKESLQDAKAKGRGRYWLSMCLISALALNAMGDKQNAFRMLQEGLEFARPQKFRRIFVDEGELMHTLLNEFRIQFPNSALLEYVSDLVTLFPSLPISARQDSVKIEGLYESLSRREMEILNLLCQGLSNREIADQFVLSVGTVKFHIHNIFGKLGVNNRPQAIAKAGLLGLVNKTAPDIRH
jgi:LuxR family maltose regulon positive regulatory protein